MDDFFNARWYTLRRAGSTKPATYRCPFCKELLPALSAHVLIKPEGDPQRRRHAHTACVLAERQAGRLPLREEVEPQRQGLIRRWLDSRRTRGL